MKIVIVDDDERALGYLSIILGEVEPESEVCEFTKPDEALEYLRMGGTADVAFLDVKMRKMNGIELAKYMKIFQPGINVIFVTQSSQYALEAFSVRASGYVMKPVSVERIKKELENLRYPPKSYQKEKLEVHTFGNFEVLYKQIPLKFARSKAKELFAYLIDRKGAGCTTAQLCAILWEDKEYTNSMQKQFQCIASGLLKTFKSIGEEDIIIRKRNFLSVNVTRINCDYYRYLKENSDGPDRYQGEYMLDYKWARSTAAFLYRTSKL